MSLNLIEAQIKAIDKSVAKIVKYARRQYVVTLEVMIQRYSRALWLTMRSYVPKLQISVGDSRHHQVVVANMVADLQRIAETNIEAAANVGFERALKDLKMRGWITGYDTPVRCSSYLLSQATKENKDYLENSLLPDVIAKLDSSTADTVIQDVASFRARIKLYGHFLWRTAERSYIDAMHEFSKFRTAQGSKVRVREGGAGSGDRGHVGRLGVRGGSAAGYVTHFDAGTVIKGHWAKVEGDPRGEADYTAVSEAIDPNAAKVITSEIDRNAAAVPILATALDVVASASKATFLGRSGIADDVAGGYVGLTLEERYGKSSLFMNQPAVDNWIERASTKPSMGIADDIGKEDGVSQQRYERAVVDHELGHVLEHAIEAKNPTFGMRVEASYQNFRNAQRALVRSGAEHSDFSDYAATNKWEYFAECYAAYINGRTIPNSARQLFKTVATYRTSQPAAMQEAAVSGKQVRGIGCDYGRRSTIYYTDGTREVFDASPKLREGGAGSGNYAHLGRPGLRGGSTTSETSNHYLVSGRVQGVQFRANALVAARDLGLKAYVRNLASDQVEILASGTDAQFAKYEDYLHKGNPGSVVTKVETSPGSMHTMAEFDHMGTGRLQFADKASFDSYYGLTKVDGKAGDHDSITAYYQRPVELPTSFVAGLHGRYTAEQFDTWDKDVTPEHQAQVKAAADELRAANPRADMITVQVNPDGTPTLSEGGHLVRDAQARGLRDVRVVVQYFGKSEDKWDAYDALESK